MNLTLEGTVTLAVITIDALYVVVVTEPARLSELKVDVSITSVTVMVIA